MIISNKLKIYELEYNDEKVYTFTDNIIDYSFILDLCDMFRPLTYKQIIDVLNSCNAWECPSGPFIFFNKDDANAAATMLMLMRS